MNINSSHINELTWNDYDFTGQKVRQNTNCENGFLFYHQLGYCFSGAICSAKTNFKKAA